MTIFAKAFRFYSPFIFWLTLQSSTLAQQTQVPTLQVCNRTIVAGGVVVYVDARSDATHAGTFELKVEASCDPKASGNPGGSLSIKAINVTDSQVTGDIIASGANLEQITSTGQSTPTAYVNGKCTHQPPPGTPPISGCRFWLLIADNKQVPQHQKTPDVVSVLVFDAGGRTVFYATGPAVQGHIKVSH
jgi:hypothetical protein